MSSIVLVLHSCLLQTPTAEQNEREPAWLYAKTHVRFGQTGAGVGASGPPLLGADFYRYVGQPELARAYHHAKIEQIDLIRIASLVVRAGLPWLTLGALRAACSDRRQFFCHSGFRIALWGGAALTTSGVGLLAYGIYQDPHPVSLEERRQLATLYNARLRRDLGL